MQIVVIGTSSDFAECQGKFGGACEYVWRNCANTAQLPATKSDVVFDFLNGGKTFPYSFYLGTPLAIFFNASWNRVSDLCSNDAFGSIPVFGFAGMRTFLDREILEVSLTRTADLPLLTEISHSLKTKFQVVKDQIGMVTPRVICMIINEAFFALEDKTATREDIDLAMKMGTNYPFGPFEWCKNIGAENVCELLKAMQRESADDRYSICSLLKAEAAR